MSAFALRSIASFSARDPAPHYQHTEIGYNYRMSNVLAAIGRGQLQVLEERVAAKRRIFDYYAQTIGDLPGISLMPEAPRCRPATRPAHPPAPAPTSAQSASDG